jgi:hypothetical protein
LRAAGKGSKSTDVAGLIFSTIKNPRKFAYTLHTLFQGVVTNDVK